jgi:predicted nucleic acid-binding protein
MTNDMVKLDTDHVGVWHKKRGETANVFNKSIAQLTMDLRIASFAIAQRMTLLTSNQVDFARVPDLSMDDWTT